MHKAAIKRIGLIFPDNNSFIYVLLSIEFHRSRLFDPVLPIDLNKAVNLMDILPPLISGFTGR